MRLYSLYGVPGAVLKALGFRLPDIECVMDGHSALVDYDWGKKRVCKRGLLEACL